MARSACCFTFVVMTFLSLSMVHPAVSQQAQPAMSRSKDETVSIPDEAFQGQAVATARKATVGQHALLMPYEQCGGEKGLCNTTTIGVPCGDHPWGSECPTGYECQRKTAAMWQCYPLIGKKDSADQGPTRFSTAPKGSAADNPRAQVVVPVINGTAPANWRTASGPAVEANDSSVTPAVKACSPGEVSVGNRCFKSSGSSRRAVAGTLAGSVLLLTAWQLVVVLATAALAC